MALIYDMCKSKTACESAESLEGMDEEDGEREIKAGGCGRYQPNYRRVGLDIFAEWKKNIDEETQVSTLSQTPLFQMFPGTQDCSHSRESTGDFQRC